MKKLIFFICSFIIFNCQLKAHFLSKNVITSDTIKKSKVVKKAVKDSIKQKIFIPDKTTSENREPDNFEKVPNLKPVIEDTLNKLFNEDEVDLKPKFNYKGKTFNEFVEDSLKIPKEFEFSKCEYVLYFNVNKNGKVQNVRFKNVRCNYPPLNNYIIDFIRNLPDYIPGKVNGKNVETLCMVSLSLIGNVDDDE